MNFKLNEFHQMRKHNCEQCEGRGFNLNNFIYTQKPFAALMHVIVNDNHENRFRYPTANSGNFDEYLLLNDSFQRQI